MSDRDAETAHRLVSLERVENETAHFTIHDGPDPEPLHETDEYQPWCPVERVPNDYAVGHVYDAEIETAHCEVRSLTFNRAETTEHKTSVATELVEEQSEATFQDATDHPQVQSGADSESSETKD